MTTETEKEFFEAFGIEPIKNDIYCVRTFMRKCVLYDVKCPRKNKLKCKDYKGEGQTYTYPEITDRILLELIVICLNNDFVVHSKNLNELQEKILYLLTKNANNKDILNTVRKLFGVEEK